MTNPYEIAYQQSHGHTAQGVHVLWEMFREKNMDVIEKEIMDFDKTFLRVSSLSFARALKQIK